MMTASPTALESQKLEKFYQVNKLSKVSFVKLASRGELYPLGVTFTP
jgi:hypothetical protein